MQLVDQAPCLVGFCISANWPQTSNQSTASARPDLFVTDHSISITISVRSRRGLGISFTFMCAVQEGTSRGQNVGIFRIGRFTPPVLENVNPPFWQY